METKLFELRDYGTFIPLLCIKPSSTSGTAFEAKMAWRYGYKDSRAVIVTHMSDPNRGCKVDPYDWGDRTFQTAHLYIEEHWDELRSGALIDVRFILGESIAPCESEA
jgi:hypothetical protein